MAIKDPTHRPSKNPTERGAVLFEAVAVIPLAIMALVGGFELIGYLETRSSLDWALSEGFSSVIAQATPSSLSSSGTTINATFDPDTGTFASNQFVADANACYATTAATENCAITKAVDSIGKSIKSGQGRFQGINSVSIQASYASASGTALGTNRSMTVSLTTRYKPILFTALWNISVGVTRTTLVS
jgi:hypothetical protein